jgi:hypothetical protein
VKTTATYKFLESHWQHTVVFLEAQKVKTTWRLHVMLLPVVHESWPTKCLLGTAQIAAMPAKEQHQEKSACFGLIP